ncbi:MAG: CHAD domain-containing protein, partial [Rhodospirillales bacterium]
RTTYYDTPKFDLYRGRAVLRVRQNGHGAVQTVKAAKGNGFIDRSEWEMPTEGSTLDLAALPRPASEKLKSLTKPGKLAPVFTASVHRQAVTFDAKGKAGACTVEAACDEGSIALDAGEVPIHEFELELKEGKTSDLFDLALLLQKECGLRLEIASKSDRGYGLLMGRERAVPVLFEKILLSPDQTVAEAMTLIFSQNLKHMLDNEAAAYAGVDPEGVHQLRLGMRQMRSALSVFGPLVDKERVAWLKRDLKWLGRCTGPARDWDVFIGETLAGVKDMSADLTPLRAEAEKKRVRAYKKVRDAIESGRYARMMLRLTAFVETEAWHLSSTASRKNAASPIKTVSDMLLSKPYKKALKSGNALETMTPDARHDLRIKMKKVRNAVMFLHGLYDHPEKKEFRKDLTTIHKRFGYLNDVEVGMRLLGQLKRNSMSSERRKDALRRGAALVKEHHERQAFSAAEELLNDWRKFEKAVPFWQRQKKSSSRRQARNRKKR